jgi:hypothetical protein
VSWVVRQLEALGYSSWAHRVVSSAGEAYRIMRMQKCIGQVHTGQRVRARSLIPYTCRSALGRRSKVSGQLVGRHIHVASRL